MKICLEVYGRRILQEKEKLFLEIHNDEFIFNVKQKIIDKKGIPIKRQRLEYENKILDDYKTIKDYNINENEIIKLYVYNINNVSSPGYAYYKGYIFKSYPKILQNDMDTDLIITIYFKENWYGEKLNLLMFKNINLVCTKHCDGLCQMQNLWCNYINEKTYIWTDIIYDRQKIMLLKLSDEFISNNEILYDKLNKIRYDVFGINNTYYGGDNTSWQRYTKTLPISIDIIIKEDENKVMITPFKDLQFDTWYITVLLNTNHKHVNKLYEDYFIPFKTKKEENNPFICLICMNNYRNILFIPCNHFVTCEMCCELLNLCPICRKEILNKIKVYF